MNKALFSSKSDEWETPQELFDRLAKIYKFNLDPCATAENAKCPKFFTAKEDGRHQNWHALRMGPVYPDRSVGMLNGDGKPAGVFVSAFVNPPYGRQIGDWVAKCYDESKKGCLVVALLPARTDTDWFHRWVLGKAEIEFLRGRIKFEKGKYAAPFPSMIAVYKPL